MLLDDMARELVRFTSEIMEGRIVNIMNTDGIIIASTEEERIGSLHQGALEAVRTGKPVAIEPEQVEQYSGAKQGYNLPLRIEGDIIGVIGMYGSPSEIRPFARLLEVYAEKYYQMEAMAVPRFAETELRSRLLRNILYLTETTVRNVRTLSKELHFELCFPAVLAVVSPVDLQADPAWATNLFLLLRNRKVISEESDLWAVDRERMVILSAGNGFPDRIRESGVLAPEGAYRVSVGDPCGDLRSVRRSFEQAVSLDAAAAAPYMDISEPGNRILYVLRHAAEEESAFLDAYLQQLDAAFRPEELRILLRNVECYYQEDRSVTRAAEKLFIHKNTLQYRLKRLETALAVEDWPDFRRECLIRLLIERFKTRQGLKTLQ